MPCPYFQEVRIEPRPCNGLNLEIGKPFDRCTAKPKPRHEGRVLAWIMSGGSPMDCCHPCFPGSEKDIPECKPAKYNKMVPE
tara:strand:- start:314 stop:559 length:246 start_codon:yes stop_codon:yes gene_type:complete